MTTPATPSTPGQKSLPLTSAGEIGCFVRDIVFAVQGYDGVERRAEPRFAISIPVEVTPYDVDPLRAHPKFVAVTRDISASGVTFLHTTSIEETYWLLKFAHPRARGVRLVLEVLYRRPIGPLWEIAGRFVTEPR
ncbi:MAG TPA: PilZ domain-containing protein [Pirellulales bacterium]|nr:PilZ domain-containing protein [Pirellulales bacterium]